MNTEENNNNNAVQGNYVDDGHIHVCVRIRDIPSHQVLSEALSNNNNNNNNNGATGRPSAGTTVNNNNNNNNVISKKSIKEAQKIIVSAIENIVILHDPKSLESAATVAKDTNHVVQVLSQRAMPPPRKSGRSTVGKNNNHNNNTYQRGLTSTATANYYECDQCWVSMEERNRMAMPFVQRSDFLSPPPYGSQEDVYRSTAQHGVKAAVEGINSCVFAYGQTGSGKTYTLFGDTTQLQRQPGIVARTIEDLFAELEQLKRQYQGDAQTDYSFAVSLSFFEIYQNEVHCLLSRQGPLRVQYQRDPTGKKETMIIHDLQQQAISDASKAYPLIEVGLRRRQTGETGMNTRSSRSHAIVQLRVTQWRVQRETRETVELHSTINLVDLAGSERQRTALTDGKSREEGIQINQSLATLARVINDIARGAKFVNYRDSLLTMVLKDNLGGNSKTFMIATISPIAFSYQESCATLAYAKDVRKIRNRPTVNKSFQTRANLVEVNLRQKNEIERLKEQLEEVTRRAQNGEFGGPEVIGLSPVREGYSLSQSPQANLSSPAAMGGGSASHVTSVMGEAILSANAKGLTAPLILSSHRRYKNFSGIGSTCVEDGLVRVTALLQKNARFSVADLLKPQKPKLPSPSAAVDADRNREDAVSSEEDSKENSPSAIDPNGGSEEKSTRPTKEMTAKEKEEQEQEEAEEKDNGEFGFLEVERVSQRACDTRVWVHFIPPSTEEGMSKLVDVQLNGKSLGSSRRELCHGDAIAVYLDGASSSDKDSGADHSLVSFHFVDLNCLSRSGNNANSATLGQLAVSVDVDDVDNPEQLKRDNTKLLDMVRQQAQTIDYQCQRESLSRLSSITPGGRSSPNPNPVERCLSLTPSEARQATVEAFRRVSVSPSLRCRSALPADLEEEELLRRAEEGASSQQRLDSALRENESLMHRNACRNAEYDELARRLAALDADDNSRSRSNEEEEVDAVDCVSSASPSNARQESYHRSGASRSMGNVSISPEYAGFSVTRVSSSSDDDEEVNHTRAPTTHLQTEPLPPTLQVIESSAPKPPSYIFLETAEGTRERYNGAFRERQQYERIVELEQLLEDLRAQIALLQSRLRVSEDDTLEQQLLRESAESERDMANTELSTLRAENAQLLHDIETLEAMLKSNEEALAAAVDMNEEEIAERLQQVYAQRKALQELARLWKRRCMKYIAQGYGGGMDEVNADPDAYRKMVAIPWNEIRAGATAHLAKYRLGGKNYAEDLDREQQRTVDQFEEATAQEALIAYESVLLDLESENERLQNAVKKYEDLLRELQALVDRLKAERDQLEVEAANASANEEEKKRLAKLLNEKGAQLSEAESRLMDTKKSLDDALEQTRANKRKAVKNNQLLLSELRSQNEALEREKQQLELNLAGKDEELRNVLNYMEGNEIVDKDGTLQDYHLRNRIEDLITDAMGQCSGASKGSAFPPDFVFSEEMIALIRVCLRIMLDRLKIELYVLNKQNVHRLSLLIPSIQLRPEAQFQIFMHELRGVVCEITGRSQRIGGKWSIEEPDILSDLVDHRRRRAGGALQGLLVWYDHWDLSPKNEHVCYMELIRNSDRIMQMARLVRQESLLNTNATSTLLMPIPGRKGASDTSMLELSETARRKDSHTLEESRRILRRLDSNSSRGALAQAVSPTKEGAERMSKQPQDNPFQRSATALALSQQMPFSRTASSTAANPSRHSSGAQPLSRSNTLTSMPPRGSLGRPSAKGGRKTVHRSSAGIPPTAPSSSAFGRVPSHQAFPVSENDITFVATTDVAQAESIKSYNFSRRRSSTALPDSPQKGSDSTVKAFSRCQTANPFSEVLAFSANKAKEGEGAGQKPLQRVLFSRSHSSQPSLTAAPAPPMRSSAAVPVVSPGPRTPIGVTSKSVKGRPSGGLQERSTSAANTSTNPAGKPLALERASGKLKGMAKEKKKTTTKKKGSGKKSKADGENSARLSASHTSQDLLSDRARQSGNNVNIPPLDLRGVR